MGIFSSKTQLSQQQIAETYVPKELDTALFCADRAKRGEKDSVIDTNIAKQLPDPEVTLEYLKNKYKNFIERNANYARWDYLKFMIYTFKGLLERDLTPLSPNYESIKKFLQSPSTFYGIDSYRPNQINYEFIELYERAWVKRYKIAILEGSISPINDMEVYYKAVNFLMTSPYTNTDTTYSLISESISKIMPDVIKRDQLLICNFITALREGKIDKASANYDWCKTIVETHGFKSSIDFLKKYDQNGKSVLTQEDCKKYAEDPSSKLEDTTQTWSLDFLVYNSI